MAELHGDETSGSNPGRPAHAHTLLTQGIFAAGVSEGRDISVWSAGVSPAI
jgi:hypothetical protein